MCLYIRSFLKTFLFPISHKHYENGVFDDPVSFSHPFLEVHSIMEDASYYHMYHDTCKMEQFVVLLQFSERISLSISTRFS